MIDPNKITNYNQNSIQLQESIVFWIAVAGKKASTIAPRIDAAIKAGYKEGGFRGPRVPLRIIYHLGVQQWREILRSQGIGCYNQKADVMHRLAVACLNGPLNLKTCSRDELMSIKGIGFKTANCFLMHSRKDARCAAFDTHLLKFMKAMGCKDVPDQAPQSRKQHDRLEKVFLEIADKTGFAPADLDLITWRLYAHHAHHKDVFISAVKQRIAS